MTKRLSLLVLFALAACPKPPSDRIDAGAARGSGRVSGALIGGGLVPDNGQPKGGAGGAGDITDVIAGNGLTGGAASGAATLNVVVDTGLTVAADLISLNLAGASCDAGSFVSAISATGTGTCTAEPGDITAVTAGTSLSGGASSGNATLNVNLPGASCAAGQFVSAISAGGTGTCTAEPGDITAVVASTGLSGGGTSGSVSLSVDPTIVQSRVSSTCAAPDAIRAIAQDGTVTCTSGTGDITAVTTAAGSGLSGGATSGAVALTMISTCNTGERLEWDGSAWQCRALNDYRGKHLEWVDEFLLGAGVSNNNAAGSIWSVNISGASATNAPVYTTTRPGIFEMTTGTTTTGISGLRTGFLIDFGSYTSTTFEVTVGVPTLSTVGEEHEDVLGYSDTSSVNPTDGCYFMYDRLPVATAPTTGTINAGQDKWQCWSAANNARTGYTMDGAITSDGSFVTVNAPVAALVLPDTNIYNLKIVETTSAGTPTKCEYYVNGVKSCEISTHLPSGSARLTGAGFFILKSAGTTARTLDVDRTRLAIDLAAARSP